MHATGDAGIEQAMSAVQYVQAMCGAIRTSPINI